VDPRSANWERVFAAVLACGCGSFSLPAPPQFDTTDPAAESGLESGDASDGTSTGDPAVDRATITPAFGVGALPAFGETEPCASWTLHNDKPLYVQAVTLSNLSSFHHSNWFVVPDDVYDGPDGYWACGERGFDEISSAQAGTVLFAQSTQSWVETQRTARGAVIKIPAHSRVVGGVHLLNLAPRSVETNLWMSLDLIHPRDVDVVLTPMRLSYFDLDIPAMTRSRHSSSCALKSYYEGYSGSDYPLKLHYALPHYHSLGDYFDLTTVGGPDDGQNLYRLEGFNADANGKTYDPPVDLSQSDGLAFSCGYDNFRSESVGWGIGDQEMCVMLLLVESDLLMDGSVISGSTFVGKNEDVEEYEGSCLIIGYPKSGAQGPPTEAEIAADLYVPEQAAGDVDLPPVPECIDADPDADPLQDVSLAGIRDTLFLPACAFSACHGAGGAAGLDLTVPELHAALLGHDVQADTTMPLVAPGDPDGSWLLRVLSQCAPHDDSGGPVSHMPRNAPVLMDDAILATVRAWIAAGAPA
jgi:mono/diheme cytochrome c family protein